ncbi:nitrogen fixation protein [Chamaesiphon sp. VAR_48_metabat_403]|uniref:nitrogen fixation protein n=1 Tax=Chamaesiphon sp. VAR_48_metabat_403 TaxID=2964700 RepID=UPI00286DFBCC|nr:nitrogen fixation protein [Chamaesiphon sp. VAR_48_metabat_403]
MSENRRSPKSLMCPSADAEMSGSVIFGIVVGTPEVPHLVHLDRVKPIPPELLTLDSPVKPSEIFRIAATCIENGCKHFDGINCRLTTRIVEGLPTVTDRLPACAIRSTCRWWHQEGAAACLRCQQVVRDNYIADDRLIAAIDPSIYDRESSENV